MGRCEPPFLAGVGEGAIEQGTGHQTKHIAELLADAMGLTRTLG